MGRSFGTKKVPDEEGSSKGSKGRCRKRMEKEGKMASVVSHSLLLQKEMTNRKVMCGAPYLRGLLDSHSLFSGVPLSAARVACVKGGVCLVACSPSAGGLAFELSGKFRYDPEAAKAWAAPGVLAWMKWGGSRNRQDS